MAATSTTETWDAAWTLTMRAKRKELTDNFFDAYPTLDMFRSGGALVTDNGGKEIQQDLMYSGNSAQYFSGYDVLNTDAIDGITAAFYPFRYAAVPITINYTEEMENRKSASAMKLLAAKTEQSMLSLRYATRSIAGSTLHRPAKPRWAFKTSSPTRQARPRLRWAVSPLRRTPGGRTRLTMPPPTPRLRPSSIPTFTRVWCGCRPLGTMSAKATNSRRISLLPTTSTVRLRRYLKAPATNDLRRRISLVSMVVYRRFAAYRCSTTATAAAAGCTSSTRSI